jgi:hypothetical protein
MASQRRHSSAGSATGRRTTAVTLTVVSVVVVALLAVAGVVALLRGGGDKTAAIAGTHRPAASASASPTLSPAPTPSSGPVASAPAGSKPVARTFQGSGNKILTIRKPTDASGPLLVVATHRGSGKFGILGLDASLHESNILVNGRGAYRGTTLLDAQGTQTRSLSVKASGPWTVKIKAISSATSVGVRAKGTGDDVLLYTGRKGVANISYRGGLNFIVQYANANEPLVDEVGSFFGQVPITAGPGLIAVKANGPWSIEVVS